MAGEELPLVSAMENHDQSILDLLAPEIESLTHTTPFPQLQTNQMRRLTLFEHNQTKVIHSVDNARACARLRWSNSQSKLETRQKSKFQAKILAKMVSESIGGIYWIVTIVQN